VLSNSSTPPVEGRDSISARSFEEETELSRHNPILAAADLLSVQMRASIAVNGMTKSKNVRTRLRTFAQRIVLFIAVGEASLIA
jgi:hypothetical protein